jgi:hypothetical protein
MESKTPQPTPQDVMELIINAALVQCLKDQGINDITLTHDELKMLIETYTIRLELLSPRTPETSAVKVSWVTRLQAEDVLKAVRKIQGKK